MIVVGPNHGPVVVSVEDGAVRLQVGAAARAVARLDVENALRVAAALDEAVRVVQAVEAEGARTVFEAERRAHQERIARGVCVRPAPDRAVHITRNMRVTLCSWPIDPGSPEVERPANNEQVCAACRDRERA